MDKIRKIRCFEVFYGEIRPCFFPIILIGSSKNSKEPEFSPRPFVRPSVRLSAMAFLEIRSLFFSETLQLVRACKGGKNVSSAFLKKNPVLPILAKNCQKLGILAQNAQKWRFFAFFSESPHYFFLILCS